MGVRGSWLRPCPRGSSTRRRTALSCAIAMRLRIFVELHGRAGSLRARRFSWTASIGGGGGVTDALGVHRSSCRPGQGSPLYCIGFHTAISGRPPKSRKHSSSATLDIEACVCRHWSAGARPYAAALRVVVSAHTLSTAAHTVRWKSAVSSGNVQVLRECTSESGPKAEDGDPAAEPGASLNCAAQQAAAQYRKCNSRLDVDP
jgi:hypothetical protein